MLRFIDPKGNIMLDDEGYPKPYNSNMAVYLRDAEIFEDGTVVGYLIEELPLGAYTTTEVWGERVGADYATVLRDKVYITKLWA